MSMFNNLLEVALPCFTRCSGLLVYVLIPIGSVVNSKPHEFALPTRPFCPLSTPPITPRSHLVLSRQFAVQLLVLCLNALQYVCGALFYPE